ncbi:hypothetical protein CL629_04045 [bacterium]|nr:hypothetical protein [bacterium]|tara:strand:- start:8945 stop:9340 length:396 start_codon:yes stop_codon:yes gene_type:complete
MTTKEYSHILERIVRAAPSPEELEEGVQGFLEYVRESNDTHLLKKIYGEFEKTWQEKEKISSIYIEAEGDEEEIEKGKESIQEYFVGRGEAAKITMKKNPELIDGVKINLDDNYLIEASFNNIINQMFSTK